MKQTAVEKMIQYFIEQKNNGASHWCIDDLIAQLHQAKAMEKEQKIEFAFDFYYDFNNQSGVPFNLISENRTNAEKYYEQKFKSE